MARLELVGIVRRGSEAEATVTQRVGAILERGAQTMKIKVVVHEAEEGGYWAEVPAIPGCATQGETFEELLNNLYEAVEDCLGVDVEATATDARTRVLEIAV